MLVLAEIQYFDLVTAIHTQALNSHFQMQESMNASFDLWNFCVEQAESMRTSLRIQTSAQFADLFAIHVDGYCNRPLPGSRAEIERRFQELINMSSIHDAIAVVGICACRYPRHLIQCIAIANVFCEGVTFRKAATDEIADLHRNLVELMK